MAKLLLFVTLVAMMLVVNGAKFNFKKFMSPRDPIPASVNMTTPKSIVESWVTQRVDNFDPTNDDTWEQRYLMNGEFFEPGGCIFVLLGGEWEITPLRLEESLMAQMSEANDCYMFHLEHRYYGQSRPTPDVSNENLRFLTAEQALADVANFVEFIKSPEVTPGAEDSPVIVIGGHYAGSLAVWFRQSFPHLAVGAWASSAPTLSTVDHFQYKELSGAVYRHIGGNRCYDRLERGFAEMEQMVADGELEELADMFQLCNELEGAPDIQMFFSTMSEFYSLLAQFDQIVNIDAVCDIITNETLSDAEGVAQILVVLLEGECVEIDYEQIIEEDRRTGWNDTAVLAGLRQWTFQSCTQFGWYHSSNSRFQPYGSSFPVEFVYQACEDVFDELYSPELMHANSDRMNTRFGGLEPATSNVLYVHGQFDPWRSVGVQTDQGDLADVIIINGASQANDLQPITEADSPQLIAAKEQIQATIFEWISEARVV